MPEVDPGDLRAIYNEYSQHIDGRGGHVSLGQSVYEQLCSPGADSYAVWYRTTMTFFAVNMLAKPIPEEVRKLAPRGASVPQYYFELPAALRQDLNQIPLPDYVFEVMARFPITGIPQGGAQGMPVELPALISELLRAAACSSPLP